MSMKPSLFTSATNTEFGEDEAPAVYVMLCMFRGPVEELLILYYFENTKQC